MTKRKFYQTTIKITVLSEEPLENLENLHYVAYNIDEGDCSGIWTIESSKKISAKEAAKALKEQGSDPEFFQIDENGNDIP